MSLLEATLAMAIVTIALKSPIALTNSSLDTTPCQQALYRRICGSRLRLREFRMSIVVLDRHRLRLDEGVAALSAQDADLAEISHPQLRTVLLGANCREMIAMLVSLLCKTELGLVRVILRL